MTLESIANAQREWLLAASAGGPIALSSATAALAGVAEAVATLQRNLEALSYPIVPGVIAVEPGLEKRIERLASAAGGTLPPVLPAFWRVVGGIALVDLEDYRHVEFWESRGIAGPQGFCDGLFIDECSEDWLDFAIQDLADQAEWPDGAIVGIPISPDGYHKDNISGGLAYGLDVKGGWLTPVQNFQWTGALRPTTAPPGPCDLLGYLRSAILECAGFPALYGVEEFEPIRLRLLKNVSVF